MIFKAFLKEAFPIVEKLSPLLSVAIGSPEFGVISNMAMLVLMKAFGVDISSIEKLPTAILSDDSYSEKLVSLEEEFKKDIANLNILTDKLNMKWN